MYSECTTSHSNKQMYSKKLGILNEYRYVIVTTVMVHIVL